MCIRDSIDTVKNNFKEEMIERISRIVDPAKIDYVISNHVEPDHSGSIPEVMKYCPNAKIVTSAPQGVKAVSYTHLAFSQAFLL